MIVAQPMDILKEALLLERRGRAFYLQVAAQATDEAVAELFETMAAEEKRHMQIIEAQMKTLAQGRSWAALDAQDADATALADMILADNVKSRIAGAGFEAAAISAAMLMEEKAVDLYSRRAKDAQDTEERRLFQWLADWEKGHLHFLVELDRDIKARIWNDNQFWPF
jgi:rubrerythrin